MPVLADRRDASMGLDVDCTSIIASHATLPPLTMFSSHSSQGYTLVPNDDNGEPAQKRRGFRQRFTKSHPLLFVGALAIAFGMFMSLRAFSRLSPWRSCTGSHRKLSNSTGGLQNHFQLPSGDKIPSVALGTVSHFSLVTRCR